MSYHVLVKLAKKLTGSTTGAGGADTPLAPLQVPPFVSTPGSCRETPHPGTNWYRDPVVWECGAADREVL